MSVNLEASRPVTDYLEADRTSRKRLKWQSIDKRFCHAVRDIYQLCRNVFNPAHNCVSTSGSLASLTPAYVMPVEFPLF